MIEFLFELLADAVNARLAARKRRRARRARARAFAAGEPYSLPGAALGDVPYAGPFDGYLVVDGATLSWAATADLTARPRHPIPLDRLVLQRTRARRKAAEDWEATIPSDWTIFELHDGTTTVLLTCQPSDADFLTPMLAGPGGDSPR